ELGCRPGVEIRVEHVAPLRDPIAVSIGEVTFSLRRKLADLVEVDLLV
ncbi:MAG: ferrous iron transport protein A, partial [Flavobacteriales bacterium]|nr:ferrous iron transport protein A [Flavobacteriales bacterium]